MATDGLEIPKEPLWFLRRVAAVVIDIAWTTFSVVFLVWLIFGQMSDRVRATGLGVAWNRCDPIVSMPAAVLSAANAAWPGKKWDSAALCVSTSYGLSKDRYITLTETIRKESVTTRSSVAIQVNAADEVVNPVSANWLAVGLIVFVWGCFPATHLMASPGLWLMRRKIVTVDDNRLPVAKSAIRLLATFVPGLLTAAVAALLAWRGLASGLSIFEFLLAFSAVVALHVLWWRPDWVGYGARRAAIHDLWCGTAVRPRRDIGGDP